MTKIYQAFLGLMVNNKDYKVDVCLKSIKKGELNEETY